MWIEWNGREWMMEEGGSGVEVKSEESKSGRMWNEREK